MNKILVKFGEIGLKGKNRADFVNRLVGNIQKSANRQGVKVASIKKSRDRLVLVFDCSKDDVKLVMKYIIGVKYYSFIEEVATDIKAIKSKVVEILDEFSKNTVIGFKTKRSCKDFPMISPDINRELANIAIKLGFTTAYKGSDETIFVEITKDKSFVYSKKYYGKDGLPPGTSGKVLVLLSGGIDSPVAAYQMMTRGCTCDFLHFHTNPTSNEPILDTKIKKMIDKINNYQFESKLFLVPRRFYKAATMNKIKPRYEMIFFKHYIFKVADMIAKEHGYDAIISGNALAQVASQTIQNIQAVEHGIDTLIFSPLLTYEKEEIIEIAKKIDTYELSIEPYRDCCSIVAKNPMTQTKLEKFKEVVEQADMKGLLELTKDKIEDFEVK